MSDYKKDETMVIYLYNTQDLWAVVSGKDFLQSTCDETTKKSHRINDFCITTTASQYKDPFDVDTELIECFFIEKDKSFFYHCDFDAHFDGGMLPYCEVHEKKSYVEK